MLLLSCAGARAGAVAPAWGELKPGRFQVGYRALLVHDAARPALDASEPGRRMLVSVWYPARPAGQRMTLGGYVELSGHPADPSAMTEAQRADARDRFVRQRTADGAAEPEVRRLLEEATEAGRDAPPQPGRFPLVVFIHSDPLGESVMSEYLASNGFIVAATESQGSFQRAYRLSVADLETMVRDAESVVRAARAQAPAAPGRFAAIGMSNGALAAVKLAMRNADLRAIVSLDGTIGEQAAARVIPGDAYYDLARISAPIAHFYTDRNAYLQLDLLKGWSRSPRFLVLMREVRHPEFLAYAEFERFVPRIAGRSEGAATSEYEWLCKKTLAFLEAALAGGNLEAIFREDAGGFPVTALPAQPD
jgi:hypothetical protein